MRSLGIRTIDLICGCGRHKEVNVDAYAGPECAVDDPILPVRGVRQAPENGATWTAAPRPGRRVNSPVNEPDRRALPARGRGAAASVKRPVLSNRAP
jgi:hypothetical protein